MFLESWKFQKSNPNDIEATLEDISDISALRCRSEFLEKTSISYLLDYL